MNLGKLRILICDDHELVRDGLKHILLNAAPALIIGEAADGPEVLEIARREKWDLVILDINLGAHSGLEILREIKTTFPRLPVLILSIYPEEEFAVQVLKAGASGYLNKNLARRTLVEAVRQVLAGKPYVSTAAAAQLVASLHQPESVPPHATLSPREDQVMRHLASGQTVGEIARELHLSVSSVSTYRSKVLEKLAVENNAQIMRYAQRHGLSLSA